MAEFLRSNDALDKIVSESTNVEQMRESLKRALAAQGVIERDKESLEYGTRLIREPEPDPMTPPKVSASYGCERILYIGNARIIITGPSEANLDEQEAAIRGQQ